MSADPLPVLLVIANQQHFFYREYNDTRNSILAEGIDVVIGATTTNPSTAHGNSGQGGGSGVVVPDIALANVDAEEYSAIVFVGGWGSSMYQYAFNDPAFDGTSENFYQNGFYNGDNNLNDGVTAPQKVIVNNLINEFLADDKYVAGICHGTTVLAWARVNGVSPINGKQVAVPIKDGSPSMFFNGDWYSNGYVNGQYDHAVANGGIPNTFNGQHGDPNTTTDDVVVDGKIITGGDDFAAAYFGTVIAEQVWANMNQAPTDLALSANSIAENAASGSPVGNLSTTDPDTGDTFAYSLVAGAGSTDNALFGIANGLLQTAAMFDFETQANYSIRVRSTDAGGLFKEKSFAISIANANESPFSLLLSNDVVSENEPAGSTIGNFSANDPDTGDSVGFSLVAGDGSTDNALFNIVNGELQTSASLNYETQDSFSIRVRAADAGGLFTDSIFSISVTNMNESPFDLLLSDNSIEEAQPAGTPVGMFSASDPDAGDALSYSLVGGEGSTDNGWFTIDSGTLKTAGIFELAMQSSYSIRVRVEDAAELNIEAIFVIQITEVNDSPVLDNSPTLMLPLVARNALDPAGVPVSSLIAHASDAETPTTVGIAISGFAGIGGTWEFSASPDFLWHPMGTVSDESALLLESTSLIRFRPGRNLTGYASLKFHAWDGQVGTAGETMNPADEPIGFSTATETAWIPVGLRILKYDGMGRWKLPTIKEDASKPAATLAKTVLGFLPTFFEAKAKLGLAVVDTTGNGEWQIRVGNTWQPIGAVSELAARLLNGPTSLRFMPAANWFGEATLTYRAWNTANGLASTHADVTSQAGFSSESLTSVVHVVPVNDSPLLDTSIARIFSLDPQSAGQLLEGGADIDSTVAGIAVTRTQALNGAWQYRLSSTGEWAELPGVSKGAALLLDPWCEIRFLPDVGVMQANGKLQYKAWDASTGGTVGTQVPATSTAFSKPTETATFSMGNQSPTFTAGDAPMFSPVKMGQKPRSLALSGLVKRMTDTDTGFQKGLAITGMSGNGMWEFTLDGGRTWNAMGDVSTAHLLLRSSDKVRFTPIAGWIGTASLEFAAWDRTTGVAGDRLDVASDAISSEVLTATLQISPE